MHIKGNYQQDEKVTYQVGENIVNHTYKGLIPKIQKEHIHTVSKKKKEKRKTNLIEKWAEDLNIFPRKTYRGLRGT